MRRRPTTSRVLLPAWLAALLACSLAHPAAAQAGDEPLPSRSTLAIDKARAAKVHYDKGEYQEALALFLVADSLYHSPVLTLHAARCHNKLGNLLEAKLLYESLAAESMADSAPGLWTQAQRDGASELQALADELPRVIVVARNANLATRLTIDGRPARIGAPVELNPGEHVFVIEHGSAVLSKTVALRRGDRTPEVSFVLSAVAPAPPPPSSPDPAVTPDASPTNFPGLIITLVGVATVGAGGIVGAVALKQASDAEAELPLSCDADLSCPTYEEERIEDSYSGARKLGVVADGLLITGAVVAVVGAFVWIFDPFGSTDVEAAFAPGRGSLRVRF